MKYILLLISFLSFAHTDAIAQLPRPVWEYPAGGFCKVAPATEGSTIALLNGSSIVILDANSGKKLHTFYLPFEGRALALSANGEYVACSDAHKNMLFGKIPELGKTIEWNDFGKIAGARVHGNLDKLVALDNGKVLLVSYEKTVLRVSKNKIEILLDNNEAYRCEGLSQDARWAFCRTENEAKEPFLVKLPPDKEIIRPPASDLVQLPPLGVFKNFTPGGRHIVMVSKEGRMHLVDPNNSQVVYAKNSAALFDYGAGEYDNSPNVCAVDFSAAGNRLMILEGPVEEIQYPQMERRWRIGELILLDLANPEPRQIALADTMSHLEQVRFSNNGKLVVGTASLNGQWTVKAWPHDTLLARASPNTQSLPKVILSNPAPELSSPTAEYEVKACVQLRPGLSNVRVGILVNGESVHGTSNLKKDGNCNIELNQKAQLIPGITNSVQINASDNVGMATYHQFVKCTAPRTLPPKNEQVGYAKMNLALIHADDLNNTNGYKRFLESEGAAVTLVNFSKILNYELDNFDALLIWREFDYPDDYLFDKKTYRLSQPNLEIKYEDIVRKIESTEKPIVIIGSLKGLGLMPKDYELVVNNWIKVQSGIRLKTKFQLPADGKLVVCEKPMFHFCLTAKTGKNDATYQPLAAVVDSKYKKAEDASPIVRFKGRYGLFGLAAPIQLWTPEAKDLLMAFLSSFCEHCPRTNAPDPERDLIVVSGGASSKGQSTGITTQDFGTYHALLIAVEDYADPNVNKLDNPVRDATQLQKALLTYYTFDAKNVTLLKNPTKKEVFTELTRLRSAVKSDDNLLIFYAGHGYWDADMEKGYWLPADAEHALPTNWIANEDVTGYIRAIKSKHTLLITDACFSGGIFKTRDAFTGQSAVEEVYKLTSRKAITSGTLTVVPDRSVFLQYLTKKLEENKDKYLSEEQLFSQFKTAVINYSPGQVPQFGTIQNTGDEGGNFIFIRK